MAVIVVNGTPTKRKSAQLKALIAVEKARRPIADLVGRVMQRTRQAGDCWEWTGALTGSGYGATTFLGEYELAHRATYRAFVGPISDDLQLDHLCRNTACCNPDHLEAVTARENTLRGFSPSAVNARKTQCPKGHEYTSANTYRDRRNKRRCRACRTAESSSRWLQIKSAA